MRFAILVLAAGLTGCAPVSIHPLYTSQDVVADSAFEGNWADDDDQIWQIQKSGDGYDVTAFHAGDSPATEVFNVHLLRLKDVEFVDATSKSNPNLTIAGHLIAKVSLQGDDLRVATFAEDWLKKAVQSGTAPQNIAGEDGQVILIAPTRDLQRFVLQHAGDADAWDEEAGRFHRLH